MNEVLIGLLGLEGVLIGVWIYLKFSVAIDCWLDERVEARGIRARALSPEAQYYVDRLAEK